MVSKVIFAAILCIPMMACAGMTPPLSQPTVLPDVSVPTAEPVVMQGYTWKVYKSKDIAKLAADLAKTPDANMIIFGVTPSGYARMNHNSVELQRYIREQKEIIVYLKKEISNRAATPVAAK